MQIGLLKTKAVQLGCYFLVYYGTGILVMDFLDPSTSVWHTLLFCAVVSLLAHPFCEAIGAGFKSLRASTTPFKPSA